MERGPLRDNRPQEEKHFTQTQEPSYKMLWLCTDHRTAGGRNLYSLVEGDLPTLEGGWKEKSPCAWSLS